jgi:hypothetical protein
MKNGERGTVLRGRKASENTFPVRHFPSRGFPKENL